MSSSKQKVLVTGSSGFLGSHIVEKLLEAGYAVRGAIRSAAKAEGLRKRFNHSDYDIVVVDDLVRGDLSAALEGISGVIHNASPTFSGGNHVEVACGGTLNVFRQAYASGIFKLTLISSAGTAIRNAVDMLDSSITVTDTDWHIVDEEALKKPNVPLEMAYQASKTLGEKAAWEFAEAYPETDLIALLPTFIYGPISPYHVVTGLDTSLSTDMFIYGLLRGSDSNYPPSFPPYVDVRDVARAAVLTLSAPATPGQQRRRILLNGGSFSWKQAVKHIAAVRPELKSRLIDGGEPKGSLEALSMVLDTSKTAEVLGMVKYIDWKKTIEDAVDSLLKLEGTLGGK